MTTYDALVVGAGPAGSTAARLLADAGWSVALVEKAAFPRRKVCGEFISATSLDVLAARGLREAYIAEAGPEVRRVGLFAGGTIASAPMPSAKNPAGRWGRALGRERLDSLLRDAAVGSGARLFQPFKLTGLHKDGGLFRARIEAEGASAELTARRVISANGSWESGVLAPPHRPHRAGDLLAFKAHFVGGDLDADLMPLLMFPGGYGGMVRTEGGRLSLSCCIRRDVLTQRRQGGGGRSAGEAVLTHIKAHCDGVRAALADAELAGPILAAGPIRPGIRPLGAGGVLRVGNAAGEAHPIIAEGISMAMQSSWLLCRRLIEAGAQADRHEDGLALERAYAADWRRQFAPRILAAQALATMAMRPGPGRLIASTVAMAPSLLTWGATVSGKTFLLQPA